MIPSSSLRIAAAALTVAGALLVAGCASQPGAAKTDAASAEATTAPVAPDASKSPSPSASADAAPTCDTLISETTVADFTQIGWTSKEEPLYVGSFETDGGIQCRWGDFTTASDHLQMFGWAPISDADAANAQTELVQGGWRKEVVGDTVYITESKDTAQAADADGYGLTYEFADGWVKYADTKQGLLLIEWPKD